MTRPTLTAIVEESERIKIEPLKFAKPTKADRKKRPAMDTTGMPFPKEHPLIDPKYRLFVRQHPCALFAAAECKGRINTAHLTQPGHAARSMKQSDANTCPLCDYHHDVIDGRVYVKPEIRNELLVVCLFVALELRETWHAKEAA